MVNIGQHIKRNTLIEYRRGYNRNTEIEFDCNGTHLLGVFRSSDVDRKVIIEIQIEVLAQIVRH